jgi:uncharacterized FlgJ-related protein
MNPLMVDHRFGLCLPLPPMVLGARPGFWAVSPTKSIGDGEERTDWPKEIFTRKTEMISIKTIYLILLPIFATTTYANSDPVEEYVSRYHVLAVEEMNNYGIPASIKLAQGILESDSGRSELAVNSRNHFGIKCKRYWIGPTYYHPDDDFCPDGNLIDSCFRVYRSVEQSFRDHSVFLRHSSHYAPLFQLETTDYRSWAKGLQSIGYATNPRYAQILIRLIETYDLDRFDRVDLVTEKFGNGTE